MFEKGFTYKVKTYLDDSERWHEWGIILFWALVLTALTHLLVGVWPFGYGLNPDNVVLFLGVLNWFRAFIGEWGDERNWDLKELIIDRDAWYDVWVRPIGSFYFAAILVSPTPVPVVDAAAIIIGFVLTYKWGPFNRNVV